MFVKGQVVKIPGIRPVYIEVEEGPFKIGESDCRTYYRGWKLVEIDDPYSEPSQITVFAAMLVAVEDFNEVTTHVQLRGVAVAAS
jgi:hypothetical protein